MIRIMKMPQSAARRLWQAGFPEDSDAFFESYRDLRSVEEYTLALCADDMWCAGLHIIPQTLCIRNTNILSGMVAGVATEPSCRKRGYAGQLMRAAGQLMREHGIALAVLDPFRESFYEPFGYRTGTVYQDKICDVAQACAIRETNDAELLNNMYCAGIKGYSGYAARTPRDWAFRLRDAQLDGAKAYVTHSAYAIAKEEDDCIRVWEYLGWDEASRQALLMGLCEKFGKPVHYSEPAALGDADTRHGAMYCPLDIEVLIAQIPAQGEDSVKLCVTQDETLKNISITAANGKAVVSYHEETASTIDAGELFLILLGARDARDVDSLAPDSADILSKMYPTCKTLLFEQY